MTEQGPAPHREHAVVDVLGVGLSALDMSAATDQIARFIQSGARTYVTVTGVHGVMESTRDSELREIHNRAGMSTCDGMPMVWSCKWAGAKDVERVYGPDLLRAVAAAGAERGWRHYFFGGQPGVADELAAELSRLVDGLQVAGTHCPPFRPDAVVEPPDVIEAINASGADIVWVGLSTPKQERWMARNRPLLEPAVLVGVGAAFDLVAGRLAQAPGWMQRSGLEWLYRLGREPRRLASRYLRNNPAFVSKIVRRRPTLTSKSRGGGG
jgi:N-acetylglucosaminyldiphosphoundecaprenol N-acetyl-beta-D-mannosaminyltransferase